MVFYIVRKCQILFIIYYSTNQKYIKNIIIMLLKNYIKLQILYNSLVERYKIFCI